MAKNLRGFRALGIVTFGALTISLVSACNGNGTFAVSDGSSASRTVATSTANTGQQSGGTTTANPGPTSTGGPTTASPGPTVGAGQSTVAPRHSGGHGATAVPTAMPQCSTRDLSAHLGAITWFPDPSSEHAIGRVPVIYTNVSRHSCYLAGFSGVDLRGPASDPNGPTYSLRRGESPAHEPKPVRLMLTPGGEANTTIAFNTWHQGDIGSLGSTNWVPTTVVVTPPNQTTSFTLPWFQGVSVLRQDTATYVATYIYPVSPGPTAILP